LSTAERSGRWRKMQLEEMNHDERSGLLKVSVSSVMRAAGTCIDVHVCGLNTYNVYTPEQNPV
jgi:hypothetical protein